MHFHDSFIAHFFPVLSLSCCHKQTSAVLLLFIIHKSNKVASQDGARRHSRGVLHHSFLLLRPLSISILSFVSRIHLTASSSFPTCLPAVSADSRKWKRRRRGLCWLLSPKFIRAGQASPAAENVNQTLRYICLLSSWHSEKYARLITRCRLAVVACAI